MKLFIIGKLVDVPNVDYLLIVTFGFFSFSLDRMSNGETLLERKIQPLCE